MRLGEERFSVYWDVLSPETWLLDDIPKRLADGYRKVRRLRTPFALHLQQSFIARLGRVGTMAALPDRYAVGVKVYLKTRANNAFLLTQARIDNEDAVCLVGRTEKNALKDWLLISEKLRSEIRRNLRAVAAGDLPNHTPQVAAIRDDPEFYRRLKQGLQFRRDASDGSKPFQGSQYDIVQILTRPFFQNGNPVDRSMHPILIEIEFA